VLRTQRGRARRTHPRAQHAAALATTFTAVHPVQCYACGAPHVDVMLPRRTALRLLLGAVGLMSVVTTSAGGGADPGWIAFSQRVEWTSALADDTYEVFVVRPDGSGLRRVTPSRGRDEYLPAWSPNGRRMAVTTGHYGIAVVTRDGTRYRPLVSGVDSEPCWSPDGRRIAFNRKGAIWTMRTDGSDQRPLTSPARDSEESDGGPAWSPDGRLIAFHRGDHNHRSIWLVNSGGGKPRLFARDAQSPAWSPDGKRLAFTGSDATGGLIYTINADGTGRRRIADFTSVSVSWSPDGQRITGLASGVFVMDADGRNKRTIYTNPAGNGMGAVWGRG
jgi:Tol biopolymer transport system component